MTQTAIEWLVSKIESNTNPKLTQKELIERVEQAKEMEKQRQDEFAIGFAEWIVDYTFNGCYGNDVSELLEEFKKEKEL